jgi:hypothetical protein
MKIGTYSQVNTRRNCLLPFISIAESSGKAENAVFTHNRDKGSAALKVP